MSMALLHTPVTVSFSGSNMRHGDVAFWVPHHALGCDEQSAQGKAQVGVGMAAVSTFTRTGGFQLCYQ